MANFEYEGDIGVISARQLEYIGRVLRERGYKNGKVLIQPVGEAGDNYVACVKRIVLERRGETFKMIAKLAPTNEAHRTLMNTALLFYNEHVMYTEVLPKFSELQKAANVPENERLRFATCYGSLSEQPNEIILLEDLQVSDFFMLDRFKCLSDETVKIVLKNFAILHSLSYTLKEKEPETFVVFKDKLLNMWEQLDRLDESKALFQQLDNDIVDLVDDKYKNLHKGAIVTMCDNSRANSKIDKDSKYSVIQQGDSWNNNIMFKLQDDKPVACCMIDYQLSREGSPVGDLQYMIFNCTDHQTRMKHYHKWIDYYHSQLDNHLARYGLKANFIYPRDKLDADMKRYAKMSFGMSSMMASTLTRDSDDVAILKDALDKADMEAMTNISKVSNLDSQNVLRFKERLDGLVNSFLYLGYLDSEEANFDFVGDISVISARQLEYIGRVLRERGYKNEKVLVQAVGEAGDNYVACVKRIIIEENGETFKMIAKLAPTQDAHRAMMNTALMFYNEHVMYTEVLPKFAELQKEANVPENERLRFATCYGSLSEQPNEVILLEDLQVSDFVMLDRFKHLSDETVKIVLKNFAILHSLSYILKEKESEIFVASKAKLLNMWEQMDKIEEAKAYFELLDKDIVDLVDDKYKNMYKGAIVTMLDSSRANSKIDKDSKYSVIQQGDAWNNNIMFKLQDDKPIACCMIDYQLSREGSPVGDLQYMIFNCTDHQTRMKHYHKWIDYYYSHLNKYVASYGLKANLIYPRDQLDADMKRYAKMSFGLSSMLASTLTKDSDHAAKLKEAMEKCDMEAMMNNSKVSSLDHKSVLRLRDRLEGLVNSFLQLGYLDSEEANLEFVGDIGPISARQLEYISGVLEELGYKNEKVLIQAVGNAGDNYLASVKRIIISKNNETFKMIAKVAPVQKCVRALMNTALCFHNEHVMYTKILPKFTEIQKLAGVRENEKLRYATCYGSLSEQPNEVILLEDLKESEFVMLDRFEYLTNESVKIVLKNMAILHSLSYVLKEREPEIFIALKNKLIGMWEQLDKMVEAKAYFEQLDNDIVDLVDDQYKSALKDSIVKILDYSKENSKIYKDFKYSVILQGDAWNNIMFQLTKEKPIACCMIDYQLSKESSPASDLQYMIFNCTDHESRSKHYNEWIDFYHSQLGKCLASHGLKVDLICPREQLETDLKRCAKMSFGMSSLLASSVMRSSDQAAKFKDAIDKLDMENAINISKVSGLDQTTMVRFKERLEGLVKSFILLGYFDEEKSSFQYDGDISSISARQLEYISSILEERGYKHDKVLVQDVGKAGDNYVANVKRFIIEKNGEIFKLIAKIAPIGEAQRAMMNTKVAFLNEHVMYTEILPKLHEVQSSVGIPESERLRYAVCYGSQSEAPNEVILLEDLVESDFVMLDRFKSLTDDSVKVVLKNFAMLHSSSFALKKSEPDTFTVFKEKLINIWEDMDEDVKIYFDQLEKDVVALVDENYKEIFKGSIVQMIDNSKVMSKIDKDSKYSVIQQGDAWNNNVMFKLVDDKTVACCMIDYQLSRESSPVSDLLYMIFNCTDHDARVKHYHEWIDYYYSQLDKYLTFYGLQANIIYPKNLLDADLMRYGKMYFGMASMLASILLMESKDAAKLQDAMKRSNMEEMLSNSKLSNLDEKTVQRFKKRLEGLAKSFLLFGYLDTGKANFQFEGDMGPITARQLKYISSILEERGYRNEIVQFEAVGKAGDNYVANVKRIIVKNDGETFKTIAKIAPSLKSQRFFMNTVAMFHNEHVMYTEVLPKFAEMQRSVGVPKTKRLRYATCYGSLSEPPNEIILLEDLKESEFVMLDRFKYLSDDSVKIVLDSFAILHSLSYALKRQEPDMFNIFKDKLQITWEHMAQIEGSEAYFQQLESDILELVDDNFKEEYKGAIVTFLDNFTVNCEIDKTSKHSVIQQGDSWNNNIMFRMENDKTEACCMIDYQISKESNPVADLQYMIFNCTDHETRVKHYHKWIDYYHTELDKCLKIHGLTAIDVFPREQLDADLKRYGKMTFGLSSMLASMLIRESEDAAKLKDAMERSSVEDMMTNSKVSSLDEKTVKRFKERLEGLVKSFRYLEYL